MLMRNRNTIVFLTWAYFLLSYIVNMLTSAGSRFGGVVLILVTGLLFFLHSMEHRGKIKLRITYFHINILLFAGFCLLSSLWALRKNWAWNKGIDLFEILIAISILYFIYQKDDSIDTLLKIIMYGSYAVVFYAFLYYGGSYLIRLMASSSRISSDAINANQLGLCAAYAIIINLYYILYGNTKKLTNLLIIPSVLILAVSGSRKALIVMVAGIFGLFILKNWNRGRKLQSALKVILVIVALLLAVLLLAQLPVFDQINTRMLDLFNILFKQDYVRSNTAWIRLEYNKLGLELFKSHPFVGIGIGSANVYTNLYYGHDHYLHNNYVELLACGGIVGTLIYYSIYAWILVRFIKYRRFRDKEYDICIVLFLIVMVMDGGMVTYSEKNTYFYLMLFWLESEILYRKGKVLRSSLRNMAESVSLS